MDNKGNRVPDPRLVNLTDWGHEQARDMGTFLADLEFDRAACSGLPRTVQTAQGILNGRDLDLEHFPEMEEIQSSPDRQRTLDNINELAYSFMRAHEPDARYGEGEYFADFEARVVNGINKLLSGPDWQSLALVCHGGVNRVVLGWALGSGMKSFQCFEQNTCCLNIIDVDTHPDTGEVVRTFLRGVNLTTYDQPRTKDHFTTMEGMADKFRAAMANQ